MASLWSFSEQLNPTQALEDHRFHRWYRFVLAYSDTVVIDLIERYGAGSDSFLLDPFCGTGTTLVAGKLRNIPTLGIDANPVAAFASKVKTSWEIDLDVLNEAIVQVLDAYRPYHKVFEPGSNDIDLQVRLRNALEYSPAAERLAYFESSGMLARNWMSELPMLQSFFLLNLIEKTGASRFVTDLMRLALVSAVLEEVSNVAYGPEIFVKRSKLLTPKDVRAAFVRRCAWACDDLKQVPAAYAASCVHQLDSRYLAEVASEKSISHVITSPPYPTEKDYTRNSRLELVFLGYVSDTASLQSVKKAMIRSHSKGIYKQDNDSSLVDGIGCIERVRKELAEKAATKSYGFAKLYPKIITEYFGGMRRHFRALRPLMKDGGVAAYVVGEQATYLQTYTPTATILGELADLEGFQVKEILPFRVRVGSTGGGRQLREEILVLTA